MTTISRLHEGKSLEGKSGEHWAKNGGKLPIVRHCRLDLTRSVRGDAFSNFWLPGREESAEKANAKKDGTSVPGENGDAENNDVSVRGRGNEVFRRCAGDVEVLRLRARAMGR